MKRYIIMSNKELDRLEVIQKVHDRRLKQKEAAIQLNLSLRQIKRLCKGYRQNGPEGLISKKRGEPGKRKKPNILKISAIKIITDRYFDFGPTLAHEKLVELHNFDISLSTVRNIMIENGIWTPKRARKKRAYQLRERRPCLGEPVQLDGSDHRWFEHRGPRCTLLVFIDDATNNVHLHFVRSENTWDYMEATEEYLTNYGRPVAFYTDKHSVFRVNHPNIRKKDSLTQYGRALTELGIHLICANTPQAKGRVERANQTLQDRLVKELRLHNISTIEEANSFLPTFTKDFNKRFSKQPKSPINAHRTIEGYNLSKIFTLKETRKLSKNLIMQYKNTLYQIKSSRPGYTLRKAIVEVREAKDGKVSIEHKGRPLAYKPYHEQEFQGKEVLSKLLNEEVDTLTKPKWKPTRRHPWKRYRSKLPVE